MAILKIARMGHPVLAEVAKPVSEPRHPELSRLVNDMVETMIDANGAGLAAPQVHVPLRLVIFQAPGERSDPGLSEDERFDHTAPLTVLINPEITILSPEKEGGWEGCLSVPGLRGWVERPAHIRYSGLGLDGKRSTAWRAVFMPGWCSMKWTIWTGGFIRSRMDDLSKLIFEFELRHFQTAG